MRIWSSIVLATLLSYSWAQETPDKVRTRTVDYAQYDQLTSALSYAPDKVKAAAKLLAVSDALFTPEDEEYFNTRKIIAVYYEMAFDHARAAELVQQAIDAYEKHFPFYHRGYATVTADYALYSYLDLSRHHRAQNLFEKSIRYLESKRTELENSSAYYVRQQFYSEYAQSLLGAERYEEAIKVALQLKDLTEAGDLKMNLQSADEIYKINATDPPEVQEVMKKAKEQYEKSIKQSQESVLSSQRLNYNTVLAQAYYQQFQFAEGLPYMKAMADELKKLMGYSRKAMADSQAQMASYNLPDSINNMMTQSSKYVSKIEEIGGSSAYLIIAGIKSDKQALVSSYATGQMDKAIQFQLNNQFVQAEQQYQLAFKTLNELSSYKFASSTGEQMRKGFLPFYLNLQVQANKLNVAYDEMIKVIAEEESKLRKNFQFFSESEKKEFFKAYNQKLEKFYSLLFVMNERDSNRAGEILNKVLQTKGIILDVTREQERLLKRIKDKTVLQQIGQIRKLRDKLSAFYQLSLKSPTPSISDSINRVSIRINELERKVNEKLGAISDPLKPINWKEVQAKLKQDEVFLEILRLRRDNFTFDKPKIQYWAFAIRKGDPQPILFMISEGEAFESRSFKNYQNRIKSLLEDGDSYNTYWVNVKEHIPGAKKIIFSGDGVYHMINPLTLQNPQTKKYVLGEVDLTRVSTGRDVINETTLSTSNQEIALLGNPAFDMSRKGQSNAHPTNEFNEAHYEGPRVRSGLSQLPGTLKEVESIRLMAMGKGINTIVLSGNSATESEVKGLKNQQILHLATHGEFDAISKADSYLKAKLILAGAGDEEAFSLSDYAKFEDGFLTAYEVTQLELSQTNLVVLSACETGAGEIQSGEGVWGLQRAFQLAGAKTVMGSLWKISDEATVSFMDAFYKKYFNGSSINASYKEAMEKTMLLYPQPYYWGAFTLTGLN